MHFGIVFIILFGFFRKKTENLYFALFCLFASMSFLWNSFNTDLLYNLESFLGIFSFEFLSILIQHLQISRCLIPFEQFHTTRECIVFLPRCNNLRNSLQISTERQQKLLYS